MQIHHDSGSAFLQSALNPQNANQMHAIHAEMYEVHVWWHEDVKCSIH